MRTVSIFSYHLYSQRRRGSMHWICDSLKECGWQVRFITCDYSLITRIKSDRRTEFGEVVGINKLERIEDNLSVGVVSTIWHPVGGTTSALRRVANGLTKFYPWPFTGVVQRFAKGSDLVILESCGALFYFDAIRSVVDCPIIYRVSDNISVVRPVPSLLDAEQKVIANADAVSVASEHLARELKVGANLRFDPMGLDKAAFDRAHVNPYSEVNRSKVVISGSSGLDVEALEMAASARPELDFYQFGDAKSIPRRDNIHVMGERPFGELIPWVKFADIGFAPYLVKPGFEYQAEHSNRLLQYVYCGLPSVVPKELVSPQKPHFIGYDAGNSESIGLALTAAQRFDRTAVPTESVLNWHQLAERLTTVRREIRRNDAQ